MHFVINLREATSFYSQFLNLWFDIRQPLCSKVLFPFIGFMGVEFYSGFLDASHSASIQVLTKSCERLLAFFVVVV